MTARPLDYASSNTRRGMSKATRCLIAVSVVASAGAMIYQNRPRAAAAAPAATAVQLDAAKSGLLKLEEALLMFEADTGRLPTASEGFRVLQARPASGEFWDGPYSSQPVDPWGNAWSYQLVRSGSGFTFSISSIGPDGKPGTSDDVPCPILYCATGLMAQVDVRLHRRKMATWTTFQVMTASARLFSPASDDVERQVARVQLCAGVNRAIELWQSIRGPAAQPTVKPCDSKEK
jgi:type II secretion system protein G